MEEEEIISDSQLALDQRNKPEPDDAENLSGGFPLKGRGEVAGPPAEGWQTGAVQHGVPASAEDS